MDDDAGSAQATSTLRRDLHEAHRLIDGLRQRYPTAVTGRSTIFS
ncbi:hypothetical protein [Mycolicibacterium sp. P1-18]|nr:hypothetical protein [Mycolicibacterium sp. P1-18]